MKPALDDAGYRPDRRFFHAHVSVDRDQRELVIYVQDPWRWDGQGAAGAGGAAGRGGEGERGGEGGQARAETTTGSGRERDKAPQQQQG